MAMPDNEKPCGVCGSKVRTIEIEESSVTFGQSRPSIVRKRVCTNPKCRSNVRALSPADEV